MDRRRMVNVIEKLARHLVRERSGDVCEGCGRARATNWAHRVARSQGGKWCPANGMHLCGSGTTGCHGWATAHPNDANAAGWCLRSYQDPETEPVWTAVRGWVLLRPDGSVVPLYGVDGRQGPRGGPPRRDGYETVPGGAIRGTVAP